jgi:hypothetical protein
MGSVDNLTVKIDQMVREEFVSRVFIRKRAGMPPDSLSRHIIAPELQT